MSHQALSLLESIEDGRIISANETFDNIISTKIADVITEQKIKTAKSMFDKPKTNDYYGIGNKPKDKTEKKPENINPDSYGIGNK